MDGPAEVLRAAGMDAVVYLKMLRLGIEFFSFVSLVVLIIILPINCSGDNVDYLMSLGSGGGVAASPVTSWWAGNVENTNETGSLASTAIVKPPSDMYIDAGDPPPGMLWWQYNPDVVPYPYYNMTPYMFYLNTTNATYAAQFATYGWRYDPNYQQVEYEYSNLDKTTISNLAARDPKLWAHAVIAYLVTLFAYWHWWRASKDALRLRSHYLMAAPPGAESHTVLCQDIPGVEYGLLLNRLDGTLLRFVPKSAKQAASRQLALARAAAARSAKRAGDVALPTDAAQQEMVSVDLEVGGGGGDKDGSVKATSVEEAAPPAPQGEGEAPPAQALLARRDPWVDAAADIKAHDGSVERMVEATFRRIYGSELSHVHLVHDTSALDAAVSQYEKIKGLLTDLVDDYISQKRRGKEIKRKQVSVTSLTLGEWGKERGFTKKPKKVDALEFWRDYLGELLRRVREEQDKALGRLYPTAFVTFATRKSQVVAARTLMSEDLSCWRAQGSPQPEEVYWPNLGYRQWERTGRDSLMWLAFVAMAAFFMIPVTAVQGLLTMNSVVSFIQSIPVANSFLTAMLPGLALKIFLAIVPIILTLMNKFSGCVSESAIDFGVVSKYFGFQVITVFLGSFIAGTFANQLQQFINNPASIVTIFGTSAPQTAIFFMTYIAIGALLQQPLGLVRLVPLVVFWVKSKLSATERAKARVWQNQENNYGTLIPNDTINMLLGVVFCTICPLIAPFALLYYLTAFLGWKYNWTYVYGQPYQSGGTAWPRIFNQLMTGLFFFHLMELAILSIKKNFGGLLMIPLLLIDVGYWLAVHARFWRPLETLSLISAAERDAAEAAAAAAAGTGAKARYSDDEISRLYLSPSFKISDEEHEEAIDEANRMLKVLAGGTDSKLPLAAEQEAEDAPSEDDDRSATHDLTRARGSSAGGAPHAPDRFFSASDPDGASAGSSVGGGTAAAAPPPPPQGSSAAAALPKP